MVCDDFISCPKCKESYHWDCSDLTKFEIKLHKNNPYKPWRCNPCKDKYCKQCDKVFSENNYESICCSNCSFWLHFNCSNLDREEFQYHNDNPESTWICPPCKGKLCVNCKISTFHKPKINCCLCNNLYHTACAGLPNSAKLSSDWLCKTCRPSVFPFHNVDHKNLLKLLPDQKFSLQKLNEIYTDMSRSCSICAKVLSKSNPGIPCHGCYSKIHVKCSQINDPKNTFHSYKGNWQCHNCMTNKFPFIDVDDSTLTELFCNLPEKRVFSSDFSLDDKLKILLSHSSKSNWYAHTCSNESDPHDNFTHKYDIKPNFHYYDVDDFRKTQATWDRNNTLTVFHTNISSLMANINKVEDLLADLAWNFDVIALSETRNDEKNKANFTPAIIDGYHTYDGTTGSSQNGGVGFYVKDTLTPTPRKDLEFKIEEKGAESETHWVELAADAGPSTLIGVFYRHPSAKSEHFMDELVKVLKKIKKEKKKTIICGDFNFNLLNFDLDDKVNTFLCTMLEYGFQPCITEPTRITNSNKPSLVDNIFTNTFDNPVSGNILELISYDHLPNFVILDNVRKKKNETIMKRDKKNIDISKFQEDLLDNDLLVKLINSTDTDTACNLFMTKYQSTLDKHAPLKKMTKKEVKRGLKPWITQGLIKSTNKKEHFLKK